jgi:hypothetical protein
MTAEEFVRSLDAENQSLLGRLAPDDTLNLRAGFDYPPLFTAVETASAPLPERCDRLISETLTQELPTFLKEGIAA